MCKAILQLLNNPVWQHCVEVSNGVLWLCPQEPHYAGHSLFRIDLAKTAEANRDYETANWILTHPRVTDGPETQDNTAVPTERPLASMQYDG